MSRGTSWLEKNSIRAPMMPYALLIQALTSTESGRQAVVLCIRVQSDEQDYQVLLEEQSHSSEAGYASDDRRIPICNEDDVDKR
jgi:hypothetical protein